MLLTPSGYCSTRLSKVDLPTFFLPQKETTAISCSIDYKIFAASGLTLKVVLLFFFMISIS
jgi:hypothetical protein